MLTVFNSSNVYTVNRFKIYKNILDLTEQYVIYLQIVIVQITI